MGGGALPPSPGQIGIERPTGGQLCCRNGGGEAPKSGRSGSGLGCRLHGTTSAACALSPGLPLGRFGKVPSSAGLAASQATDAAEGRLADDSSWRVSRTGAHCGSAMDLDTTGAHCNWAITPNSSKFAAAATRVILQIMLSLYHFLCLLDPLHVDCRVA